VAFASKRADALFGTTVSAATYTFSPSVDIEVGDLIVLSWNANAASQVVSSVADNSTQAGSANSYTVNPTRSGSALSAGTIYCRKATRKILTTDVITITIGAAQSLRSGCMAAFVPANAETELAIVQGVTADITSPVTYAATGTLPDANCLLVQCSAWRGGAVDGGYGHNPSGWATANAGGFSGGGTSRHESHIAYILDSVTNGTVTCEDTYTSITNAHGEVLVFTDVVLTPGAFPVIPTSTAGRVLATLNTAGGATKTFPNLSSLTKDSGDLLLAIAVIYDGASINAEFSSWGGGFTEIADRADSVTMSIGVAWKISDGTETGTFTVTTVDTSTNDSVLLLLSIPGAHATTEPEVSTMMTGTEATIPNPPSLSPSWGADNTLWIAVGATGEDSLTGSFTGIDSPFPTNYVNSFISGITADAIGGMEASVIFRQLNAATEDPGTFGADITNVRHSAVTIAVRPTEVAAATARSEVIVVRRAWAGA
jgi:hypothetical protein